MNKDKLKSFYTYLKKEKKIILKRISKQVIVYSMPLLIIYILILYIIFFHFTYQPIGNYNASENLIKINDLNQIQNLSNLQTYLRTSKHKQSKSYQPINAIIITDKNITQIFDSMNWVSDVTFKDDILTIPEYYYLYKNKTLPVINLYLTNKTQDYSFQSKSNTISQREHIRLWGFGYLNDSKVYLASISSDDGFTLSYYSNFIVPIHKFNPDIDKSRDLLLNLINQTNRIINYEYLNWSNSITNKDYHNHDLYYYTDGNILVLNI